MADAQPAFPSRRSQRQAVRDAHVPQPIPAPEEAPAAQQAPVPMPEPPVPPVPLPPPQAPSMLADSRGGCNTCYALSSSSSRCLGVSQLSVLRGAVAPLVGDGAGVCSGQE